MVSPELTASLIQTFKIFDDFGLYEIKDFLTITLYPEMIHEDLLPKMGNAISAMAVPTCDPCAGRSLSVASCRLRCRHDADHGGDASHVAILYAAMSETSSNCWKFSVINEASCWEYLVDKPSRASWMAA